MTCHPGLDPGSILMRFFSSLRMTKLSLKISPVLIFTISGRSMYPTFLHGEKVVVIKKWLTPIKKDDVVVLKDTKNMLLIKRVQQVQNKKYFVGGDNESESTDSRHFGWITDKDIIGRVIALHS